MKVTIVAPGTVPRSEGGKLSRVLDTPAQGLRRAARDDARPRSRGSSTSAATWTPIYAELTDGYREQPRVSELVYAAAERFPEQLPSRAAIDAERELLQKDKQGLEISQGIFVAHVLAHPRAGFHLMHSMSQPTGEALARLEEFRRTGSVDLGPMRVDRDGDIGHVTVQNHAFLNSEDDVSTAALEVAVDLVLLDDEHPRRSAARRARHAPQVRGPAHPRLRDQPDAPLQGQDLAGRVHARARARPGLEDVPRPRPRGVRRGRARAPPREAVDRGRRQLRDRRDVPVAARHGLRDRRGGLVLRAPGAQGGDHPGLRQPAPAALRGRAHRPPGALLQPLVPGGQPRGAHARRRGACRPPRWRRPSGMPHPRS